MDNLIYCIDAVQSEKTRIESIQPLQRVSEIAETSEIPRSDPLVLYLFQVITAQNNINNNWIKFCLQNLVYNTSISTLRLEQLSKNLRSIKKFVKPRQCSKSFSNGNMKMALKSVLDNHNVFATISKTENIISINSTTTTVHDKYACEHIEIRNSLCEFVKLFDTKVPKLSILNDILRIINKLRPDLQWSSLPKNVIIHHYDDFVTVYDFAIERFEKAFYNFEKDKFIYTKR